MLSADIFFDLMWTFSPYSPSNLVYNMMYDEHEEKNCSKLVPQSGVT